MAKMSSLLMLAAVLSTLPLTSAMRAAPRLYSRGAVSQQALVSMIGHRVPSNAVQCVTAAPIIDDAAGPVETSQSRFSGLQGKALQVAAADVPTKAEVRAVVPDHCYERSTLHSMGCVLQSALCTAACALIGTRIPMTLAALPLWLGWSAVTGTVAMGLWVLAHECGHGAFSDNRVLQDAVGFVLHSALLVPYFSWQRSHAVHHARTNHITEGETHVPTVIGAHPEFESGGGEADLNLAKMLGHTPHGVLQVVLHLLVGWPAYLLFGATGGPRYGLTNHFVPRWPFSTKLWPNKWPSKVWASSAGVAVTLAGLAFWARTAGLASVLALYGGPLIVVNAWLVLYTWLQHTEVDVPHLGAKEHNFMRGAFLTIDRPYGRLFDWLHHRIGSTHVAHHIDCTIPHYHAREATDRIAEAFPKAYLYDPTPVHQALWRVACNCIAVKRGDDGRYTWASP